MPTQQMGISQIKVPKMPNQIRGASHPEDYQELIANHEAHSMVWERAKCYVGKRPWKPVHPSPPHYSPIRS